VTLLLLLLLRLLLLLLLLLPFLSPRLVLLLLLLLLLLLFVSLHVLVLLVVLRSLVLLGKGGGSGQERIVLWFGCLVCWLVGRSGCLRPDAHPVSWPCLWAVWSVDRVG